VAALRADGVTSVFTIGFCMGGRMSFLASTLGLDLAGVIGLYGTLEGPWRNDAPAPLDRLDDIDAPVLGLFGGADEAITADAVAAFERGLAERAIDHRVVTYPGAPHSFFDRKATEFASESAAAWDEITSFIAARTGK
jgi:carboxymethylenebutenolidase